MNRMEGEGITTAELLDYHVQQMEQHRYLLTLDQETVGARFIRDLDGDLVAVPLHPERGVCVICDIRTATASKFWRASDTIVKMIGIDKPNYYESVLSLLASLPAFLLFSFVFISFIFFRHLDSTLVSIQDPEHLRTRIFDALPLSLPLQVHGSHVHRQCTLGLHHRLELRLPSPRRRRPAAHSRGPGGCRRRTA